MPKGDDTRSAILDEAMALASQVGFELLTIGELAKRTELSKSGLFRHFGSKEELQIAVLDHTAEAFTEEVILVAREEPDGLTRLRAVFEGWLAWVSEECRRPGGCPFMAASSELDDRPGKVRDRLVLHMSRFGKWMSRRLEKAKELGEVASDLDVQLAIFEIDSALHGYQHYSRLYGSERALDLARRSFERALGL